MVNPLLKKAPVRRFCVAAGGADYGQRVPVTFGGPFTWAGQRYIERSVSKDARRGPP